MLVLKYKIGCITRFVIKNSPTITIKILSYIDGRLVISSLSKKPFLLDSIRVLEKSFTLRSGQSIYIKANNKSIKIIFIESTKDKIILGFDADKSVKIIRLNNRKRISE